MSIGIRISFESDDEDDDDLPDFLRRDPTDLEDELWRACEENGPHVAGHAYCAECGHECLAVVPVWRHYRGGTRPVFSVDGAQCPACARMQLRSMELPRTEIDPDLFAPPLPGG